MARATRIRRLVVPPGCYSRVLNLENACEWKRNGKGGRRSWVSFSRVSSRDVGEGKGGFFRFDRVPLSNIRRLTGHRETMDVCVYRKGIDGERLRFHERGPNELYLSVGT